MDYRMLWLNPANRALHFGYWDASTRNHSDSLLNMNRVLSSHARPKAGQLVLDAGCGVGGTAMWMVENHGVRAMGITVTPSQVTRARRYAAERGLGAGALFSVQDYCHIALPDDTFDIVYGLESVNYAPDKRRFIAEAFRVLKPGGRFVVQDGFRSDRKLSGQEERLQESWLAGWLVPNLSVRQEFAAQAKEAGFVDVEDYDCTENVRRSCRRLYRVTMACLPGAIALRKLGLRTQVQHANVIAARDQWRALQKGLWGYGIVAGNKPTQGAKT